MTVIELDRKRNVLRIGNNSEDIKKYTDVTVIYNVSHVTPCGDGWYDIHHVKTILGHVLLGHVTDVESVQEKW